MNFRAIRSALLRACHASSLAEQPAVWDEPRTPPRPAREFIARLAEVFAQVPADFVRLLQIGQRIDETEELHLEGRVVHPQAHQLVFKPRPGE